MQEGPTERDLKELIGIAIGEASMCWIPSPMNVDQTFDSTKASAVCDRVTCDVLNIIASKLENKNRAINIAKHRLERCRRQLKGFTNLEDEEEIKNIQYDLELIVDLEGQ